MLFFKLYNDTEYPPSPLSPFRSACIPKPGQRLCAWIALRALGSEGKGRFCQSGLCEYHDSRISTKGEPLQKRSCASWGQITQSCSSAAHSTVPLLGLGGSLQRCRPPAAPRVAAGRCPGAHFPGMHGRSHTCYQEATFSIRSLNYP